ncbi:hypothetical protein [Sphingomonas flavescens]|uniref:hypothetical protein n=1 Tax=Sphingomonas flavescens TaxID=3132797 RepID=UPI002805865A|nr:hypothetical protein [Sphingomonas limnosediminicola]
MRSVKTDAALDALNDERDHLAIQINLAADSEGLDMTRLSALRQKLARLELKIQNYRPATA